MAGLWSWILCGLIGAALTGCQPPQDPFLDLVDSQLGTRQQSDLEKTMGLAASDTSYDYRQYEDKISGGLNRWINRVVEEGGEAADDSQQWQPLPAVRELIEAYQEVPGVAAFDQRQFVATDPYFVRGRSWMKAIARRVCESPSIAPVELMRLQAGNATLEDGEKRPARALVGRLHPELSPDDAARLADAILLFDWTVRNIQLEDPLPVTDSNRESYQLRDGDPADPASLGVPGPGYRRFVWQVLVFARADALERARLFSGLCRQREIDTVLLYAGGRPWAVAALIGGKAWLFDPKLGLPLPGAKPGQIATLDELRSEPARLKSLSLSVAESSREDAVYWIRPEDLDTLRADVIVSPESVSRRMTFLENRLIGDQRLVLTDDPARTMTQWSAMVPDVPVELSRLEFETHRFRRIVSDAIKRASADAVLADRLRWYWTEEAYVDQFVDYRSARNLFFMGRFEVERGSRKMSAVSGFFSLLYPDDLIANIAQDAARLNRLGVIRQKGQSAAEFQRELEGLQQNMRLVRRDVGVFLAQSHFDNGNVSSCGNWLERLQQREDTERWLPIMRYLEGRSLEAIRDYGPAIEHYRSADGPQFLGNMLRARYLTDAVAAAGWVLAPAETGDAEATGDDRADAEGGNSEGANSENVETKGGEAGLDSPEGTAEAAASAADSGGNPASSEAPGPAGEGGDNEEPAADGASTGESSTGGSSTDGASTDGSSADDPANPAADRA